MKKRMVGMFSLAALVGIATISAQTVRAEDASLEGAKQKSDAEFDERGGLKASGGSATVSVSGDDAGLATTPGYRDHSGSIVVKKESWLAAPDASWDADWRVASEVSNPAAQAIAALYSARVTPLTKTKLTRDELDMILWLAHYARKGAFFLFSKRGDVSRTVKGEEETLADGSLRLHAVRLRTGPYGMPGSDWNFVISPDGSIGAELIPRDEKSFQPGSSPGRKVSLADESAQAVLKWELTAWMNYYRHHKSQIR